MLNYLQSNILNKNVVCRAPNSITRDDILPTNTNMCHSYRDSLSDYLQISFEKIFRNRDINEIYSKDIARDIANECFQRCPDWGQKEQFSSTIVCYHKNYCTKTTSPLSYMNVHTYAYLACEAEDNSCFAWFRSTPSCVFIEIDLKMTILTIEYDRIQNYIELIRKSSSISETIKIIKKNNKITWDDF